MKIQLRIVVTGHDEARWILGQAASKCKTKPITSRRIKLIGKELGNKTEIKKLHHDKPRH